MKIPIHPLESIVVPLLLSAMVAALPPIFRPCITTGIIASTSTATAKFQPPNITPATIFISRTVLELRLEPTTTAASINPFTKEGTSLDPSNTITTLTLPSGITNIQEVQEKWYQTTYWSCITDAIQTHCGWHEPVLPSGDDSIAGAVLERKARPLVAIGIVIWVALLVAMGL